jgi:pyruvate dehydrogenase E2 component (dihydrolipoamide acetyltransferase)
MDTILNEEFDIFRKVVAFSTSDSWKRVPHVAYLYEPDVTDFFAFYRERCRTVIDRNGKSKKITFGTLLLKVIAEGLVAAPRLNAFLRYNPITSRGRLLVQRHVNVTLPWLLENGKVVTVVVPHVEETSIADLQAGIESLARRIDGSNLPEVLNQTASRDTLQRLMSGQAAGFTRLLSALLGLSKFTSLHGKERRRYYAVDPSARLTPEDISTGTVVVSNIGSIQGGRTGKFALLDIVAPQVFAVGISAVRESAVVVTGRSGEKTVTIRSVLPFCLVFDHRAFEFGELLPFLTHLDRLFADPSLLVPLLDGAAQPALGTQ